MTANQSRRRPGGQATLTGSVKGMDFGVVCTKVKRHKRQVVLVFKIRGKGKKASRQVIRWNAN